MRFQALFFLLLLTCMYLSLAQGSYGDCCIGHVTGLRKNVKKNVEGYRMQVPDGDCNIRAVVFNMKKRPGHVKKHTICANPDHQWVRNLMKVVDGQMAN